VAYDQELAQRIRDRVAGEPGMSEQAMFGGLAFLAGGNMAIAASGQGGLLVRVDAADSADLVRDTAATPFEMRGKAMAGWLRVPTDAVEREGELQAWIDRGVTFARSLPPKRP
jgi:TfoX N-terminal domain